MLKRMLICVFIFICLTSANIQADTSTPTTLLVQASVAIGGTSKYNGKIKMDIGVYELDIDDPPIWIETFPDLRISNGSFIAILGSSKTLTAEIFNDDNLRIGFTPYINDDPQQTDFIMLKSVPYSFHSDIATKAEKINNEQLMKLDEVNMRVGINNIRPEYALDVGGTVKATAFIGDGSQLTNINVSDDRLIWLKTPTNPNNVYYSSGNVGIHTKIPGARLDVSGNVIVSGNLRVGGLIQANALKGDGSQITNINASQITQGTLHHRLIVGDYPQITGIGTITSGIWQGAEIEDQYIVDQLTINGGSIEGANTISGNLILTGPTTITGSNDLSLTSPQWKITNTGDLSLRSVSLNNTILISGNAIETNGNSGLEIRSSSGKGLFISPTGSIGINTTTPATNFDVNGGIKLGSSQVASDGVIRFHDNKFEGFRQGEWVQLDHNAQFDSHALHAEGNGIQNLIYITDQGKVGIGGIPSNNITDHLVVSGNVVFNGKSIGSNLPNLTTAGTGTRMMWYPKKTAFRSGYVETTQWDDANIGQNSVAFGDSGLASEKHTVIIGGKSNINRGESSVIIGGYNNHIKLNSHYSVIVGGGTASGGGNIIDGGQYSTIIGGQTNKVTGKYSSIIGGAGNTITGDYSVAMGKNITIDHEGTFIFSDGKTPRQSSGDGQFLIYATGNVGIGIAPESDAALNVGGTIKAFSFSGDGSQLSNISANKLGGYAPETVASPNSIYVSDANGFLPENTVSGTSIMDGTITSEDIQDNSISGDKIAQLAISGDKIKAGAITNDKIADGAITTDKIQHNAIASKNIADGSIVSKNIAPNAIKTYHIAANQVTNEKIALDTIDSSRIVDQSITSQDIALGAIASINIRADAIQAHHIAKATIISDNIAIHAIQAQHIGNDVVSSRNIGANQIFSAHIVDYNVLNTHITDNAIESYHIADNVITNSRINDNTITAKKIGDDAIEAQHLANNIILERHIADNAIQEEHINIAQINGDKLADGAIISTNIALGAINGRIILDSAVQTNHILDGTITSKDIALGAITGDQLAKDTITSLNIAVGGIASFNIQKNAITSLNIVDFSIVSADIMDGAIEAPDLSVGSITSEKISDGQIQDQHIADHAITSRHIADASIPWHKITTDPIPANAIADNAIPGTKLMDGSIPGSKIQNGTITSEKLADNSISASALIGVLPPDKGGTGVTDLSALADGIVIGVSDGNGSVSLGGDKTKLSWDHANQRLGINTATPLASLHVKGNVLTESGGVYFGSMNDSISFGEDGGEGFIIVGPDLSNGGVINGSTEPLGTLKTNKLLVSDKVGIGVSNPTNALDIAGSMAIGSGFAGTTAPENGLIIEGYVGIGTPTPAHALDVNGSIKAKGIWGKSTDTNTGIGIKGIGGKIGILSNGSDIGIDVSATQIGIKATATGEKGVSVLISNAQENLSIGVLAELKNPSGTLVSSGLGKLTSDYSAAVFGTVQNSAAAPTNWAAYFDGPVKMTGNLGIGLSPLDTPQENLHIKNNALFEKTVYIKSHIADSPIINWGSGNKITHNCSGATPYSFTSPTNDGSYLLTLMMQASNSCTPTFPAGIKWEKGTVPTGALTNGMHIFSFLLQISNGTPTYYGLQPVGFN
jgi:hypothetical protein